MERIIKLLSSIHLFRMPPLFHPRIDRADICSSLFASFRRYFLCRSAHLWCARPLSFHEARARRGPLAGRRWPVLLPSKRRPSRGLRPHKGGHGRRSRPKDLRRRDDVDSDRSSTCWEGPAPAQAAEELAVPVSVGSPKGRPSWVVARLAPRHHLPGLRPHAPCRAVCFGKRSQSCDFMSETW